MVTDKFTVGSKEYEIRVEFKERELEVRAFHNGQPANGYSYHVTLETAHDLNVLAGQDAVKELVAIAKNDVTEQRYEKLIQALKGS